MGQFLSNRDLTTDKTGGQVPINVPKLGGGYITKRINVSDLLAGVGGSAIKLADQTGNVSQILPANTWVEFVHVRTISGTPTIKIGTTLNGNQILDTSDVGDSMPVMVQLYFANITTLYFAIVGGNVNIRIEPINDYN
jgi:hypothetical protein